MKTAIYQILVSLVILTILFGIYLASFKYHKPIEKEVWTLRGDEISGGYQK